MKHCIGLRQGDLIPVVILVWFLHSCLARSRFSEDVNFQVLHNGLWTCCSWPLHQLVLVSPSL